MTNPLENALQRGTFNVLDAARGRGYPTDTVTVFTAKPAAHEARKIQIALGDETDPEKVKELETSLASYIDEIKASALRFYMRGVSPGVTRAIDREAAALFGPENPERPFNGEIDLEEWAVYKVAAAHIYKVEDAQGNVDESEWDLERFFELSKVLPDSETGKILEKVTELSFASAVFDEVVGPDFS